MQNIPEKHFIHIYNNYYAENPRWSTQNLYKNNKEPISSTCHACQNYLMIFFGHKHITYVHRYIYIYNTWYMKRAARHELHTKMLYKYTYYTTAKIKVCKA